MDLVNDFFFIICWFVFWEGVRVVEDGVKAARKNILEQIF